MDEDGAGDGNQLDDATPRVFSKKGRDRARNKLALSLLCLFHCRTTTVLPRANVASNGSIPAVLLD